MRSITALILMIALASTVGCQATTKGGPGPVASAAESSASPTRSGPEAPDADALALGAPPPPPEQFVAVPRLGDVRCDYDADTIRPEDAPILDGNAAWV